MRLLLEVGALSIKRSKTLNFSKGRRGAYLLFYLKDAKENSGGTVLIKCVFPSVLCQKVSGLCHGVCVRV